MIFETRFMTHDPQLLVYKASAGSGKTFTLAVQYIRHLIEDPYAYRRILAVTFTNKATAEMKDRILSRLYGIAYGDKDSDDYLREIRKNTTKSDAEIRKSARTALHNMIHDYSRFRIETIDSFFQTVMRNLARELELGANLSIELNAKDVLSESVDSLIGKLTLQSPVLYWLIEYIEERIADDRRWNVSGEIKRFGGNIFNETYIEYGKNLREKLRDPQFIPRYRKQLCSIRTDVLEQEKGFSEQFFGLLDMNGLSSGNLKNGSRGIASYFNKLANGNLKSEVRNQTVEKCLESAENWVNKTSARRDEIIALANKELIPLLEESEKYRVTNNRILNTCDLSLRYLNNLRLLTYIDEEVHLQNQMHNRFLLADTNALLHNLMQEGDASFVYEKIGTTIDTVMIDEFQDTSRMQWENFRILLQESLSQKEGSLIVGDIKQSIYRWRNGDWRILAGLDKENDFRVNACSLVRNWRSEANIVRFNNAFFTKAVHILAERYEEEEKESCEQLTNAYADVRQETGKKDEKGFVKLAFLSDTEEESYEEAMLRKLADEVEQLVRQGVRIQDMAILVRMNKNIPLIADYFDKHTSYRIVSDEAFRLDASSAVCMLVDGIKYLSSPEDRVALARLSFAYCREVRGMSVETDAILSGGCENFLPEEYICKAETLRMLPLYELLERLFSLFDVCKIQKQDAYLCAFFDAVIEYIQKKSSDLSAFIVYWDEQLHAKTIPSGEVDGIRILSIHKAKGLEFHTVLLPFCDWKMENSRNEYLVWCSVSQKENQANVSPFDELDLIPVNYSGIMRDSLFRESYVEERLQLWVDNLNLLYVAFTRACKNLFVWGKSGQKGTVSELLEETLSGMDLFKDETNDAGTYRYGTLCLSEEKEKSGDSSNRLSVKAGEIPVTIEPLSAEIEFKQSNRSAEFIRGDEEGDEADRYVKQGRLLHYLFASVGKEDDLSSAIEKLCFEGVIESCEQEARIRKIALWALNHPQAKKWYDGSWSLYNERNIIFTDAENGFQTRRPDRVMMKDGQIIVVDFKFGKKKDVYDAQVKEYMKLLSDMGYKQVRGYLWYVYSGEIKEVNG